MMFVRNRGPWVRERLVAALPLTTPQAACDLMRRHGKELGGRQAIRPDPPLKPGVQGPPVTALWQRCSHDVASNGGRERSCQAAPKWNADLNHPVR